MNEATLHRMVLVIALLLASLSLVAWRQGRALGVLTELDAVQSELGMARSDVSDINREIQIIRSRNWVVGEARRRLDLHRPEGQVRILHVETSR